MVQKRSRVSPAIRGQFPVRKIFLSENGEFWCILSGILSDLELQESKQETRYGPGKSKGAGYPTRATRPHFKPWFFYYGRIKHAAESKAVSNAFRFGL